MSPTPRISRTSPVTTLATEKIGATGPTQLTLELDARRSMENADVEPVEPNAESADSCVNGSSIGITDKPEGGGSSNDGGTNGDSGFPMHLTSSPMHERLRYFDSKIISHDLMKDVVAQILLALRYPANDALLVWVCGPSGVGKTAMSRRLVARICEEAFSQMQLDPGMIPAAYVEAALPKAAKFDWPDLYTRILLALNEPLIKHKVDFGNSDDTAIREGSSLEAGVAAGTGLESKAGSGTINVANGGVSIQGSMFGDGVHLTYQKRIEIRRLWYAIEQCLIHRGVRALFLDEAHHFKKGPVSGRALLDQMDALKSLANVTRVPLVLLGTYELRSLMGLEDELCRRSTSIHFRRYRVESNSDMESFRKPIFTFQRHLPLKNEPDLVDNMEYIYTYSLGCVGLLKTWLYKALAAALEDGEAKSFHEYLERTKMPSADLLTILRRITEGENWVEDSIGHEKTRELQMLLYARVGAGDGATNAESARGTGRDVTPLPTELSEATALTPVQAAGNPRANTNAEEREVKRKRRRRVGERNPHRDTVGA